eukprot:c16831_g1_i1.p1 GENE.c16831_g1_i1~~c16831_g1_i1.p1  ORF type:complete len:417 (-),score=105.46 c16831_g1_i1:13-1095(-)
MDDFIDVDETKTRFPKSDTSQPVVVKRRPESPKKPAPQIEEEEEEEDTENPCRDAASDGVYPVKDGSGNPRFECKVAGAPELFKFVIGKQGSTKKGIEQSHSATVKVPKQGSKDVHIVIRAATERSVLMAREEVKKLMSSGKQRLNYTHFISFPLRDARTVGAVADWQKSIASEFKSIPDFDASIMLSPAQLHLTVVMLRLITEDDLNTALNTMARIKHKVLKILNHKPLRLHLRGIDVMNCDPSATNVLHAQVNEEPGSDSLHRLKELGAFLVEEFKKQGLTDKTADPNVKFHATLVNTKVRSSKDKQRVPFDGRPILQKYESHAFGAPFSVQNICIAKRGQFDENGSHFSEATIQLPE